MKNRPAPITPKRFLETISILHMSLIVGPIVFAIIAFNETEKKIISFSETVELFLIVVPSFALGGILLGNFIFKQTIKNIAPVSSLRQKLIRFQTASIVKYLLLEAASLFSVIAFLQTRNLIFLMILGMLVLYFLLLRPTKTKIERVLNLKENELAQFNRLNQPLP